MSRSSLLRALSIVLVVSGIIVSVVATSKSGGYHHPVGYIAAIVLIIIGVGVGILADRAKSKRIL
ncbi:MAG: hypothetical protein JWN95_2507 [Frankiales bacterium]|nr:hypothetical protein [Frankiales bacterium]